MATKKLSQIKVPLWVFLPSQLGLYRLGCSQVTDSGVAKIHKFELGVDKDWVGSCSPYELGLGQLGLGRSRPFRLEPLDWVRVRTVGGR